MEARIAGLEGNAEYMSLLREDAQLQLREDSIVNAVERMRQRLREDPSRRQELSQEILQQESRIFEIRNAKGRLIDRINTIEQEWVPANLNGAAQQPAGPAAADPAATVPDSLKVRNLVDNLYFREHLPAGDYEAPAQCPAVGNAGRGLRQPLFRQPRDAFRTGRILRRGADRGRSHRDIRTLQDFAGMNGVLADSLAATWNYIFDNKNYAYGYLLDKMGKEDILAREEEELSRLRGSCRRCRARRLPDAVADYLLRKRVIVDYEASVAGVLGLDAARDR